jgi:cation diffusion facilitator CzcD-associated flavoprotein CzcO
LTKKERMQQPFDLIVIGGGPAGIAGRYHRIRIG